jgi:hypothetical protein
VGGVIVVKNAFTHTFDHYTVEVPAGAYTQRAIDTTASAAPTCKETDQ